MSRKPFEGESSAAEKYTPSRELVDQAIEERLVELPIYMGVKELAERGDHVASEQLRRESTARIVLYAKDMRRGEGDRRDKQAREAVFALTNAVKDAYKVSKPRMFESDATEIVVDYLCRVPGQSPLDSRKS